MSLSLQVAFTARIDPWSQAPREVRAIEVFVFVFVVIVVVFVFVTVVVVAVGFVVVVAVVVVVVSVFGVARHALTPGLKPPGRFEPCSGM